MPGKLIFKHRVPCKASLYVCAFLALGIPWRYAHARVPDQSIMSDAGSTGLEPSPLAKKHYGTERSMLGGKETCLRHVHDTPLPKFKWMATEAVRQRAQVNPGDPSRLRAALARYTQGQNLTVSFLGGSITAGQGAVDGKPFPYWAEDILTEGLAGKGGGSTFHVHNGAVPGTLSSYMSVCHNIHASKAADIVFIDYTLNDPDETHPPFDNPVRRPFERLMRKLLNYPRRPAVILIHAYKWFTPEGPNKYWRGCERDFHDIALYYGLPELSVKAAAWNLMRTGAEGYDVKRTRGNHMGGMHPKEIDVELMGKVFYWDIVHPDGLTGHKFMGEIAAQLVLDAFASVTARPLSAEEVASIQEPLPPPMIDGNWESASDKCFIGPGFEKAVFAKELWVYKDEGSSARPKLGYVSDQPSAVLRIKVNTTSSTGNPNQQVIVEISYLKSYMNMGQAAVKCESGCVCEDTKMDCHTTMKTSLLNLHEFKASQNDECVISITILPETSSGKHKIKIAGIMISEEGGGEGTKNGMAIDMIMEGMSAGNSSAQFDMKLWGRLM